jgi:signal transduction histidine kinase
MFKSLAIQDKSVQNTKGFGLKISKMIVKKMKGKIWFTSVYKGGSSFSFEMALEEFKNDLPQFLINDSI